MIANVNIQKSNMSLNFGEIVAKRWCLAQKVVAFFFFEQQGRVASPKVLRVAPACLLVRSKKFPMTVAHCRVQKINF